MSRNNKNARLIKEAKQWAEVRKGGGSGPKKTEAKHGKVRVQWKSKEVQAARNAVLQKTSGDGKTVLEKLKGTQ
jgi:hypothetical protein